MPWGKYCGWSIAKVPTPYLVWALEETNLDPSFRPAIREEVAWRLGLLRSPAPPPPAPMLPPGGIAPAFRAMLEAGYRALALQHHPDRGGDAEAMKRLNGARDWCRTVRLL
jgi:hypothetical protein